MMEEKIWALKYRPRTVRETILPEDLKKTFQKFVDDGDVPNLLLTGPPGVGKTTIAMAMLDEIGADYILINGSLSGNIDTLRNEIMSFASTVSFAGGRKFVIIDEADYLNAQSTQPALRGFIEEFSKNCGFILTCNFKNRLIEPLHSRMSVVDFKVKPSDKPKLAMEFLKMAGGILEKEGIEYDKKVVAELILQHFPDFRRVINELQRYAGAGKIDNGILKSLSDDNFKSLVKFLKDKSFSDMRKWVVDNSDIDPLVVMRAIYDNSVDYMVPAAIAQMVVTIAEYQYKHSFVADQEVNLVACLTEIMVGGGFK